MKIHLNQSISINISNLIRVIIALLFFLSSVISPSTLQAQEILNLPVPGAMVVLSGEHIPTLVKGLKIYPDNPLKFDFIVEPGQDRLSSQIFEDESMKMIKYFLAALTIPKTDMWVNLSPHERNRVIPESFGQTAMGRDLLAQDYMLKQLTASLVYPEDEIGAKFWERVYKKAQEEYGTTEIPLNTFNKVWIVPDKAEIYETNGYAFVVGRHLKVMLEEEYFEKYENGRETVEDGSRLSSILHLPSSIVDHPSRQERKKISKDIIKEIIIPEIEKEINTGKNFSNLRQVYNAMILATWFKKNLHQSLLGQVYVDQGKIKGIDLEDKEIKEKIYDQYMEAFQKGVYNYIKEDYEVQTQSIIQRKYFSGGAVGVERITEFKDRAQLGPSHQKELPAKAMIVEFNLIEAAPDAAASAEMYTNFAKKGVLALNALSSDQVTSNIDPFTWGKIHEDSRLSQTNKAVLREGMGLEEKFFNKDHSPDPAMTADRSRWSSEMQELGQRLDNEKEGMIKENGSIKIDSFLSDVLRVPNPADNQEAVEAILSEVNIILQEHRLSEEYTQDDYKQDLMFWSAHELLARQALDSRESNGSNDQFIKNVERLSLLSPKASAFALGRIGPHSRRGNFENVDIRAIPIFIRSVLPYWDSISSDPQRQDEAFAIAGNIINGMLPLIPNYAIYLKSWLTQINLPNIKALMKKVFEIRKDIFEFDRDFPPFLYRSEFEFGIEILVNFNFQRDSNARVTFGAIYAGTLQGRTFYDHVNFPKPKLEEKEAVQAELDELMRAVGLVPYSIQKQVYEEDKLKAVGSHQSKMGEIQDISKGKKSDAALTAEKKEVLITASKPTDPVGGIDFNEDLLDLQIKRDTNGVPLPLNLQPIKSMKIDGFIPVIINIQPVTNLPLILGFDPESKSKENISHQKQMPIREMELASSFLREVNL